MKKITFFILTIFTVATLFAAARPSLDGRAVVAESGTMPRGLFARTVGYLPGDSVSVTNPATGSTVDVLILGAIDPSEGVAILLSPEAAEALRIKPESNVQVKLTKRTGSLDENANGSAVLSDGESASEEEVASSEGEKEAPLAEESPALTETVTESPALAKEVDEEVIPAPVETAAAPVTPLVPVAAPLVSPDENETPETVYENLPAAEENLEKVTEKAEEESPLELQKVVVVEEEKAHDDLADLPAEEEKITDSGEILQPVILTNADEDKELEPVALDLSKKMEEKVSDEVLEEILPEDESPVTEEIAGAELEPEVVADNAEVAEAAEEDAYQPIILVPTNPNPPVAEAVPVAEEKSEEVEVLPPAPMAEKTVEKAVVTNDWTNYIVPSMKNLRKNSYYIQVASLGNTENINGFIDQYTPKYPVVLVENNTKTLYQVMVGPLNIDEYGSVMEKFKNYGFKDSFLRKIN